MKVVLIFVLGFSVTLASAQRFSITGQLVDTVGQALPSATVLLLNASDSSLANFSVTDATGHFAVRNVVRRDLFLKVTFVGFRNHTQRISFPADPGVIDLGRIVMQPTATELEAIEITGERAPVTVKRDTIEFNASSFKTRENAVVEDLLRKLPGVEVDKDGNITAQGEQVRRVTVDGKNFFGSDPKVATRNLPADAVEKVQVYDQKSDQAVFSGIDDGQREKTVNLALKEEKKHGVFGTLVGGGGTNDRYQARANINRFTATRQLSFLGMANNLNEQGFSMEDYMNFTGGSQIMMGGGGVRITIGDDNSSGVPLNFENRANGIMSSYAAGVNVNNEFNKRTEAGGSYFFNYLDHEKDQSTYRENFLPNSRYSYNERSKQTNSNLNHRVNATVEHKLDSMNSFKLVANATWNETDSYVESRSETLADDRLQNSGERLTSSSGTMANTTSSLLWRHRFPRKGRNFSATLEHGFTDSDRDGALQALNYFYGDGDSTSVIEQTSRQNNTSQSYSGTVSYTEPLGRRRYLEASYSYRMNQNDVMRNVFDVNNGEAIYNVLLSNRYGSNYQYNRAGLNFRIAKRRYNFVVGGSLQDTRLQGEMSGKGINRSFRNLLPTLRLNYDFSDSKHFGLDYETSVQEPGILQLQPVVDNSDPLNLYVGNPALRPAYVQSWRANFMTFDPATFVSFFAYVDFDHTTNAIVNAQSVDERLVRTTTPVNVGRSLRASGNVNFGFPVTRLHSRFNFGLNYRHEQSLALLNDIENQVDQQLLRGSIRYNFRHKEILDLNLSAEINRQATAYKFGQPDQRFINQTYTGESVLSFARNYQFTGTFEYLVYTNTNAGFRQTIPLVNLGLSRFLLKGRAGELKLSVVNLLDKALGVSQVASVNYLERQLTNSLGRYFLLSFSYALNRQLNPMGMGRGGAMMRIIR